MSGPAERRGWKVAVGGASTAAALAGMLFAFGGCGGCGSHQDYPPNLTFPPRADRLVLKLPDKRVPAAMNTAGKRDEEIAALDALGGKTVDPATLPADARGA